eukprot:TRINITY_DN3972_c0_g1_i3.p1 TRINITY_DN3972_c0_g1~~TRINITY_DN3972_c0_g1_i3.p1  ORF type:complete len:299 (-),score=74.98 TRINITY_DN3972_c0_g1_i3:396-1250(-)
MWQSLLCLVVACNDFKADLLSGDTVQVTSILNPPYLQLRNDTDGPVEGMDRYEGFIVDLLYKLEDMLGVTFNINLVKDEKYGYCHSEENEYCSHWTGMIGEVYRGDVDMAVADITVAPKRLQAVDFSQSFYDGGLVLLAPKKGNLDTVEQAVQSGYKFIGVKGGSTQKLFESSQDPLLKSMRTEFSADSVKEAYAKMKSQNGKVGVVVEQGSAKHLAQQDCSVKVLTGNLNSVSYGIALPKGAAKRVGNAVYEVRTLIDHALATLKYKGELASLERKWWTGGNC